MHLESRRDTLGQVVERLKKEKAVGEPAPLRDVIFESWQRCALGGLKAEQFVVPYRPDIDNAGRLAWAAGPALERAADDLQGTPIALVLTDERGHVLARREGNSSAAGLADRIDLAPGFLYSEELVGTNAIGTALEIRRPSVVLGYEHFAHALTAMGCAASPVTDPANGRVIGVIDLTCAAEQVTSLMLPLAKRIAWEIEQRLLDDATVDQRILREQFLKARRSTRSPLLSISQSTMLASGAAAAVLQPSDRDLIWHWATRALEDGARSWSQQSLTNGRTVLLRCEPVRDGARVVGAIVHLDLGLQTTADTSTTDGSAGGRVDGWTGLTSTERAVADQVSRGLTNAEIAAHLVLSPHTIDYHLRHIYRKLDVRSRVELTRVILQRRAEL